jgi:hypothetical protein
MNTTRKGKIARLPQDLREELNLKLDNNEPGPAILEWLNGLEETQAILNEWFDRRPVSEQNLSEWRQGGFQDWLQLQEARRVADTLREHGDAIGDSAAEEALSQSVSTILTVEFAVQSRARLDSAPDEEQKWKRLVQILRELDRIRRSDQRGTKLRIDRQLAEVKLCVETELAERGHKQRKSADRQNRTLAIQEQVQEAERLSKKMGPGLKAEELAARRAELNFGLDPGELQDFVDRKLERIKESGTHGAAAAESPTDAANQAKSDQIKPFNAPGRAPQGGTSHVAEKPTTATVLPATPPKSDQIKPFPSNNPGPVATEDSGSSAVTELPANPAKSNQIKPFDEHSPDSQIITLPSQNQEPSTANENQTTREVRQLRINAS